MTGTERKALNKYFPPDFDPRKIPKCKFERNRQYVIRVMAPFNMRCNTCGEYIYKGKKFNARRETVEDNDYLGLSLFRFYIRCPGCLAEITFTTDLKNCDYANEHGATRLFEAEKLLQAQDREILRQEAEDATNPMKMLEKRTKMSRFEMDALERLEELKEMNQRHAKTDYLGMIKEVTKERELALKRQEEEDEAFVKAVFHGKKSLKRSGKVFDTQDDEDGGLVDETNSDEDDVKPSISHLQPKERDKPISKKPKLLNQKALLSGIVVKKPAIKETKNAVTCSPDTDKPSTSSTTTISSVHSGATASSGLSLLGNYDESSDDSSD